MLKNIWQRSLGLLSPIKWMEWVLIIFWKDSKTKVAYVKLVFTNENFSLIKILKSNYLHDSICMRNLSWYFIQLENIAVSFIFKGIYSFKNTWSVSDFILFIFLLCDNNSVK
jgi:hypothetical protein